MIKRVRNVFFVCYSDESKGFRLYNPITKKLIIRRDVIFYESSCWEWAVKSAQHLSYPENETSGSQVQENKVPGDNISTPTSLSLLSQTYTSI